MIPIFSDVAMSENLNFLSAVKKVLDSHWYVLGEEVAGFESEFAAYVGVGHCVSMANGTDAIEIALRCVGVGRGDLVVTVANAGFYSSAAIYAIGATPLYVDINMSCMTMSIKELEKALKKKPKCVIVTHIYGQMANIKELVDLTHSADVILIEDCAQSHGAKTENRQAGSWGDAACFSFYPTKNLGAMGDGGAVVTNNDELAVRLKSLRQYGWSSKYHVDYAGGKNSRLDEIQAAILRLKLPYLNVWNAARRDIAFRYNAAFTNLGFEALPSIDESFVAHLYVARIQNRDSLRQFLKTQGVATDVHYPVPDHLQSAYTQHRVVGTMEVTENLCKKLVTLPCFPGMPDESVDAVITAVKKYFEQ